MKLMKRVWAAFLLLAGQLYANEGHVGAEGIK